MRRLPAVFAFALILAPLTACGGSTAVNFYGGNAGSSVTTEGAGAAGSLTSAGQASSAAGAGSGVGGTSAAGDTSTSAAGTSTGDPSDAPCSPVVDGMGGMTGPFGTTGPYCLRVSGDIVGWGCSNFQGRTLKVNGTPVTCEELPLPDKLHGDYYFDVSAGGVTYASMFWY